MDHTKLGFRREVGHTLDANSILHQFSVASAPMPKRMPLDCGRKLKCFSFLPKIVSRLDNRSSPTMRHETALNQFPSTFGVQ